MEMVNRERVEQLFSPLRAAFSSPRPDGNIVMSLVDEEDITVYSRVLQKDTLSSAENFAKTLEEVRLELAVRAGNIPADLRKVLKEQHSVSSEHIA